MRRKRGGQTQFGDLRGWIDALRKEGELHQIDAEVDWDCELGTVTRRAFGNGDGPALLFTNIKDYNKNNTRCTFGVHRWAVELFARRHDVRPAEGRLHH